MNKISIFPPLIGAMIDIKDVPDEVFANKMVGDGVAIDPFTNIIYAPITGIVKSVHKSKHAITFTGADNIDILLHIGLETVGLKGDGFKVNVVDGDSVNVGDIIGEFDIDYVSQRTNSLISPVLLIDSVDCKIKPIQQGITSLGNPIMEIYLDRSLQKTELDPKTLIKSAPIIVANPHGIHARPAALISSASRKYNSEILLEKNDKLVTAKSIIALLGLSINQNDTIFIHASTQEILNEIANIVNSIVDNETNIHDNTAKSDINKISDSGKVVDNKYYGIIASEGICKGYILNNQLLQFDIVENANDTVIQQERLLLAIHNAKMELERKISLTNDHNTKAILSAHLEILTDPYLLTQTLDIIKLNKTAQYAITTAIDNECEVLAKTGNQLLVERQADLRDVYKQILLAMDGVKVYKSTVNKPSILIADELTPSDVIELDKNIVGLVSVKGGVTSHVAILAKTRNIPLLVGVSPNLLSVDSEDETVLNTQLGFIDISPTINELDEVHVLQLEQQKARNLAMADAKLPAITIDGCEINCMANIANVSDAKIVKDNGADGIGLFRTEFMFLDKNIEPTELEQEEAYFEIIHIVGDNYPFIIRTLDAGGEKQIAYLNMPHEVNPVLGVRGIRLCLEQETLFVNQLSAILRLNNPNVKILLPMISSIEEYRKVRNLIEFLKEKLFIKNKIELGIMVEVPSVVLQSDVFASEVDFFSIGTNDLSQYLLAIDREHAKLATQIDHLHPSVLKSISLVISGANKYNRIVSVCGLMASEPLAIPILIGLGIKNLSMNINAIAKNKVLIRKLDYVKCQEVALKCLEFATSMEVRKYVSEQFIDILN